MIVLDNSIFFIVFSLITFKFIGQVQFCETSHKKLKENKQNLEKFVTKKLQAKN